MLSHSSNPSPDEHYDEARTLLRLEQAELKRDFTQFCSLKVHRPLEPYELEASVDLPDAPPVACRAEGDFQWLVKEQAARDRIDPAYADIAPTKVTIVGNKCYLLALPSVKEPLALEAEAMMPLALLAPESATRFFLTTDRHNELFANSIAVGVIADYNPDSRTFRHYPVFTQRAFELATLRAQAIGASIWRARRSDPHVSFARIEPSSVVTAILWALESDDVLPAPHDRDAREWPILGLSRLSVPNEGGSCEIGFLRISVKTSRFTEQVHSVSLSLNDFGMLESIYEQGSTRSIDLNN